MITGRGKVLAGLVVLMIMLTVCRGAMAAQVKPEGELRIGVATLYGEQMDPILCSNLAKFFHLPHYDVLVGVTDDGKLSTDKGVAYKWESSPDFMSWTFFLRKGIKFHNGDELDAKDVKFSIERAMSPKSIDVYKPYLQSTIKSIDVLDPSRLVIRLNKPDSRFIYYLTPLMGLSGLIMPKDYITANGAEYFVLHPIGSGPYRFVEQSLGSYIKFEALEKHWRVGVPKFKTLVFRQVPEENTRVGKLRTDDIDIIEIGRERRKEIEDAGFRVIKKVGSIVVTLFVSEQWRPESPLNKEKVRQALNLAINREELLKYVFLDGGKITGIGPSGSWAIGYPTVKPYDFDVDKAKKLLAEAGYAQGFELDVYSYPRGNLPENETMMQALAGYWSKIGVKPKIIPIDYVAYRKKLVEKTLGASVAGMPWGNRLFADDPISQEYHSKGAMSSVNDPVYDQMIDKTKAEVDSARYAKLCEEIQRYAYDHFLTVPIIQMDELYATNKKVETWNLGNNIYDLNVENVFRQK